MRFVLCLKAEPPMLTRTHIQGLPISIEARRGTRRHGRMLPAHYGRIPYSRGADGDALDAFVGDDPQAETVYICRKMTGPNFTVFDEEKCMIGFASQAAARACFCAYYGERALGACRAVPLAIFRQDARRTLTQPGALHAV